MRPVEFEGQTIIIAKHQPEYQALPANVAMDGTVTCCWELTPGEMEVLRLTKRIWIQTLTFRQPMQPILPSVEKPWLPTPEDTAGILSRFEEPT